MTCTQPPCARRMEPKLAICKSNQVTAAWLLSYVSFVPADTLGTWQSLCCQSRCCRLMDALHLALLFPVQPILFSPLSPFSSPTQQCSSFWEMIWKRGSGKYQLKRLQWQEGYSCLACVSTMRTGFLLNCFANVLTWPRAFKGTKLLQTSSSPQFQIGCSQLNTNGCFYSLSTIHCAVLNWDLGWTKSIFCTAVQ